MYFLPVYTFQFRVSVYLFRENSRGVFLCVFLPSFLKSYREENRLVGFLSLYNQKQSDIFLFCLPHESQSQNRLSHFSLSGIRPTSDILYNENTYSVRSFMLPLTDEIKMSLQQTLVATSSPTFGLLTTVTLHIGGG